MPKDTSVLRRLGTTCCRYSCRAYCSCGSRRSFRWSCQISSCWFSSCRISFWNWWRRAGHAGCAQRRRQAASGGEVSRARYQSRCCNTGRILRTEPIQAVSLPCRLSCPLAYFRPRRVRPVNFQACHSKYQRSRRQAEMLSLFRCGLGQALTFAQKCHYRSLSKVRDEKSHICWRSAQDARSSIDRNCRKPATAESLPQTRTDAAIRSHRIG
jgi:hypothetical protein